MSKYKFSQQSYDKLKKFLELVERRGPGYNSNSTEIKKIMELLPQVACEDINLSNNLTSHTSPQNDVIEVMDDCEGLHLSSQQTTECSLKFIDNSNSIDEIKDVNAADESKTSYLINNSLPRRLKLVVISLKQMLDSLQFDNAMQLIIEWEAHEQHLNYIFGQLQDHPNVINLSKNIATYRKSTLVQIYWNIVINRYIFNGKEIDTSVLLMFFENHPQEIFASVISCLFTITEENKISRNFLDSLLFTSENNKCIILSKFINECTYLTSIQLTIVRNLIYNDMNLVTIRSILELLSKNCINLTSHRNFGLLLENFMQLPSKSLLPLREELKKLLNLIPGILRLKLLQILTSLEQKECNFSETMQF